MQPVRQQFILSDVRKMFADKMPAKQTATEMRPLTDDELRAVAGGPELEVGNGV